MNKEDQDDSVESVSFLLKELQRAQAKDARALECMSKLRKTLGNVVKENEDLISDVEQLIVTCEQTQREKLCVIEEKRIIEEAYSNLKRTYTKSENHYVQAQELWKKERKNLEKQIVLSEARIKELEYELSLFQGRSPRRGCMQSEIRGNDLLRSSSINRNSSKGKITENSMKDTTPECPSTRNLSREDILTKALSNTENYGSDFKQRSNEEVTCSTDPSTQISAEISEAPTTCQEGRRWLFQATKEDEVDETSQFSSSKAIEFPLSMSRKSNMNKRNVDRNIPARPILKPTLIDQTNSLGFLSSIQPSTLHRLGDGLFDRVSDQKIKMEQMSGDKLDNLSVKETESGPSPVDRSKKSTSKRSCTRRDRRKSTSDVSQTKDSNIVSNEPCIGSVLICTKQQKETSLSCRKSSGGFDNPKKTKNETQVNHEYSPFPNENVTTSKSPPS